MNKNQLEGIQILAMIIMIICVGVIGHKIAVAFGFIKTWYILFGAAVTYQLIEEKIG